MRKATEELARALLSLSLTRGTETQSKLTARAERVKARRDATIAAARSNSARASQCSVHWRTSCQESRSFTNKSAHRNRSGGRSCCLRELPTSGLVDHTSSISVTKAAISDRSERCSVT